MARLRAALTTVLLAALAGCGQDGSATPDAAPDAAPDAYFPPPPTEPAMPVFTPCPAGWREVTTDTGVVVCDPWPEGGPQGCADDEAHFPGEPGCSRIGSACPVGDGPEGLPADRPILHVRAGAGAGGTGTEAAPFATIAEATAVATTGTIIAIGKGTFDESVVVGGGVTLWGACVSGTVITRTVPSAYPTITLAGLETEVRNLRVTGRQLGIQALGSGVSGHVEDVVIAGAERVGWLVASGATASGRSVAIRDTRARPEDLKRGRGLDVEGGHVELSRAVIERNRDLGVLVALAGSFVRLEDVVVRDTLPRENDSYGGRGLAASDGATVEVARAVFERNRDAGVRVGGAGTTVRLEDVRVLDTASLEALHEYGRGLGVTDGATVEVTRAAVERNRDVGVFASQPGTTLRLTDVLIRDTQVEQANLAGGRGLNVQVGAHAEVTRAVIERNAEMGVYASGVGTVMSLQDVRIRDTRSREVDLRFGRGLDVEYGAAVEVDRAALDRNCDVGASAFGLGSSLVLRQTAIRGTLPQWCEADGSCGWDATSNLGAYAGAHAEATGFLLSDSSLVGVQLAVDGTADLHDGLVTRSPIGANVQTAPFDVARLADRVLYVECAVHYDGTFLPVPEPLNPLDEL